MYADDTTLCYTQPNLYNFEAKTNHEIEKVSNWFKVNTLVVSLSKTNYTVFHSKPCNDHNALSAISLSIDSVPLNTVNAVNFLGVHIQINNMHWDLYITNIVNKISKCIGILYK